MDTLEGAPALSAGDRAVLGPNELETLNRFFDGVAKDDIAWRNPQSNGGRPVFTENWLSVPQVVSHNSRYGDLDLSRLGRDFLGGDQDFVAESFDPSMPPQSAFSMAGYYKVPTTASDLDPWWTSPNMLSHVDPMNPFSARPAAPPNNVDPTGSLIPELHWDGVFTQQHQGVGPAPVDQPQFGSDTRFQRDGFLPGLEGVRAAAEAAAQLEQLECLRPNHSSAPTPTVTTPQPQQQPILWGPAPGGSSAGPARKPSAATGEPLSIVTAPTTGPSAQHYHHQHHQQQHPLSPDPTPTTTTTTTTTLTSPKRKKPKPIKDTSSADKKAHNATPTAARKKQKLQHPHHHSHQDQPLPPTPTSKQPKHPPQHQQQQPPKPKRRSPETEAERLARLERQRSKHNDSEKHRRGRVDYLFEHLKGLVPATQSPQQSHQGRGSSNGSGGGGGGGGGRGASKAVALAHAAAWVEELQRGNVMLEQVLRGVGVGEQGQRGAGVTVG